jgi:hypothetical protein
MLKVHPFNTHVSVRLLEFFGSGPWFRRLWNAGLSMTLSEILEASHAVRRGVLSKESLRGLMQTAQKLLARDCALPLPEQKRLVQKCLSDDLRFESAKYAQLRLLQDDLDKEYLLRWSEARCRSWGRADLSIDRRPSAGQGILQTVPPPLVDLQGRSRADGKGSRCSDP